jgi:hypothetical protein
MPEDGKQALIYQKNMFLLDLAFKQTQNLKHLSITSDIMRCVVVHNGFVSCSSQVNLLFLFSLSRVYKTYQHPGQGLCHIHHTRNLMSNAYDRAIAKLGLDYSLQYDISLCVD